MMSTQTLDSFSFFAVSSVAFILKVTSWPKKFTSEARIKSIFQPAGRRKGSEGYCELFLKEESLKLFQYVLFLIASGQNLFSCPQGRLGNCLYFRSSCTQLESLMVKRILAGNSSFCHSVFEPWCLWEHPSCKNTIINISPNNIDLSRPCMIIATTQ